MFIKRTLPTLAIAILAATPSLWSQTPAPKPATASTIAFRDAVVPAPKDYPKPVFKLSRNYPHSVPETCDKFTWLKIPVNFNPQFPSKDKPIHPPTWHNQHWDEYINAILNYVKENQDPQLSFCT